MNLQKLRDSLEGALKKPEEGLSDEVFTFVASVTPMVNVDLLLQDKYGRVLLAWRRGEIGDGWHIPGGIIRFKEDFRTRIIRTAQKELGTKVTFDEQPLTINQIFMPYQRRGHFISFLHRCYLPDGYTINNDNRNPNDEGYLAWHDRMPDSFITGQGVYRRFLEELFSKVSHEET